MKKCYKKHPLHAEEEAEETLVERSEAADLASAEAHGIFDIDPCGKLAQFWCNALYRKDFEPVYEFCMAECAPTQNTKRSETVDNTVQLEAAALATTEAQGIFDIDPCGYTAQAWCTYKAYTTWWFKGGFEHVYEKCMAKCGPSQMDKRSETIDTASASTLKSSNMVGGDDDLTEEDEHSDIWPQEGRLGGLRGVNDADNHVCNDTLMYAKCSFLASLQFWHPKTAFRRCLAECVRKHDGDNWTEEDVECDE
jgi:hypothetical protein